MMVGRWVSFWDCLFLGAMLNFWGVLRPKWLKNHVSQNFEVKKHVENMFKPPIGPICSMWIEKSQRSISCLCQLQHQVSLTHWTQNIKLPPPAKHETNTSLPSKNSPRQMPDFDVWVGLHKLHPYLCVSPPKRKSSASSHRLDASHVTW